MSDFIALLLCSNIFAVWPSVCNPTIHFGITLLNPRVKTEYMFPAAVMRALLSDETTDPSHCGPSLLYIITRRQEVVFVWSPDDMRGNAEDVRSHGQAHIRCATEALQQMI